MPFGFTTPVVSLASFACAYATSALRGVSASAAPVSAAVGLKRRWVFMRFLHLATSHAPHFRRRAPRLLGRFSAGRFRKIGKTGFRKRSCPREKLVGNRFKLKRLPVARRICPWCLSHPLSWDRLHC